MLKRPITTFGATPVTCKCAGPDEEVIPLPSAAVAFVDPDAGIVMETL